MQSAALFAASLLILATADLAAAGETFPYAASVQADVVDVRSGPGETYYATGQLTHGDAVTVHRHDRGGWFMISPPAGSFSYIRVEHVQSSDGKSGLVNLPDYGDGRPALSVVRIGSALSDDAAFSARQLSNGEAVQIIGRKMVETDAGQVEMYKILPPDREFRWVKGDFIKKSGQPAAGPKSQPSKDLFDGALVAEFGVNDQPEIVTSGDAKTPTMTTRRQRNPSPDALLKQRQQLSEIDAKFKAMVARSPDTWDLDSLNSEYSELLDSAVTEIFIGQVKQRLAAVERRREVLNKYLEFQQLTAQTDQNEQQLLAQQQAALRAAEQVREAALAKSIAQDVQSPAGAASQESPSKPKPSAIMPKLDGAGLVQKTSPKIPGGPRYAVFATDGRTLAYLVSTSGVELEPHVGEERGLVGRRVFDPRLGADVIDVKRLVPVRLKR